MKNHLTVYIEGKNPSGRDIQNFCAMIEACSVLSVLDFQIKSNKNFRFGDIATEYNDFLAEKYMTNNDGLYDVVERMTNLVMLTAVKQPMMAIVESNNKSSYVNSKSEYLDVLVDAFEKKSASYIKNRAIDRLSLYHYPILQDFNEWIAYKFGNKLLETEHVATTNSIEFIFNLISITAILGYQNIPEIKDMALYIEGVFGHWMGKQNYTKSDIKIPTLPRSMASTIDKFDDVEIEVTNEGVKIKLKKHT